MRTHRYESSRRLRLLKYLLDVLYCSVSFWYSGERCRAPRGCAAAQRTARARRLRSVAHRLALRGRRSRLLRHVPAPRRPRVRRPSRCARRACHRRCVSFALRTAGCTCATPALRAQPCGASRTIPCRGGWRAGGVHAWLRASCTSPTAAPSRVRETTRPAEPLALLRTLSYRHADFDEVDMGGVSAMQRDSVRHARPPPVALTGAPQRAWRTRGPDGSAPRLGVR